MRSLFFVGAFLWLSAAVAGTLYLTHLENTPADQNVAYPGVFPSGSNIRQIGGRATLIFFAHPKCPCTRSSVNELARLMAETQGKLTAYVVFIKPADAPADWMVTDLLETARTIPGVEVVVDENNRETDIFNARTSGTALLYSEDGRLLFDGGLTRARGHEGDNAGRSAIARLVLGNEDSPTATAIYGCPLQKQDCPAEPLPEDVPAL